jgi:hypothetical protein
LRAANFRLGDKLVRILVVDIENYENGGSGNPVSPKL